MKNKKLKVQRKIKEEERKQRLRKKAVIGFATIISVGVIGYGSIIGYNYFTDPLRNLERIEYSNLEEKAVSEELKDARNNPIKRQQYIDDLLSDSPTQYSPGVFYDHDGSKIVEYVRELMGEKAEQQALDKILEMTWEMSKDGNFEARTPILISSEGEKYSPKIFVGRKFFENNLYNDDNIKHAIRFHEYRHGEQASKGLGALGYLDDLLVLNGLSEGEISQEVDDYINEVDARNFELEAILSGKSKVTQALFKKIKTKQIEDYITLKEIAKNSNSLQKKFIEEALEKISKPYNIRHHKFMEKQIDHAINQLKNGL